MSVLSAAKDFATTAGGGAVIGSALGLGGGALSAKASAKQAKKQMEFQERMSNTAYQRSADDLEAAGLNRILALGSPATTPGGAMGQVPDYGSAMAGGANAGINLATGAQQINKQDAEIKSIIQNTKNMSQQEKLLAETAKTMEIIGPMLQDTAVDFRDMVEAGKDLAPVLYESIKKDGQAKIDAVVKVIADKKQASINEVSTWFDTIEAMTNDVKKIGSNIKKYLTNERFKK